MGDESVLDPLGAVTQLLAEDQGLEGVAVPMHGIICFMFLDSEGDPRTTHLPLGTPYLNETLGLMHIIEHELITLAKAKADG